MEINATILLQLALFLVLMVLLSQFLFQPLLRLFDARERRIDGAQEEAKQYRENADQKAAIIEERVQDARHEARETLNDFKARAKDREDEIIGAAREHSQARLNEARQTLEQQVQQAKAKLNNDAMTLAEDMAAKALGRAL
jgi:F-type H+-transporting ATPase subunit b